MDAIEIIQSNEELEQNRLNPSNEDGSSVTYVPIDRSEMENYLAEIKYGTSGIGSQTGLDLIKFLN